MSLERADAKHHGVRCLIPMSRPGSVLVGEGRRGSVAGRTASGCDTDIVPPRFAASLHSTRRLCQSGARHGGHVCP